MALKGKRVTVFGGAKDGLSAQYPQAAFAIGAALATHGAIVVNGAGNSGLMRATLDGAKSVGGTVKVWGMHIHKLIYQGCHHTPLCRDG